MTERDERAIRLWLLSVMAMVVAMVAIGGITRLTDSGLSMMEWRPIAGFLPPLSEEEWQRVFALYKAIPEYWQENAGMTLEGFKGIFWWEYIHRVWGRLIGIVFTVPFLYFLFTKRLTKSLSRKLTLALILGGAQGLMGWYMVMSGFQDRLDVSQYRLAAHLGLAFVILGYLYWLYLDLRKPQRAGKGQEARLGTGYDRGQSLTAFRQNAVLVFYAFGVVLSGAFVAGTDAGLIYNSFPLMGGEFIPSDYRAVPESFWQNAFESHAAIQFHHRWLAVLLSIAIGGFLWGHRRLFAAIGLQKKALTVLFCIGLQIGLGIATLLSQVWVPLAVGHQLGAVAVFCALIALCHGLWQGRKLGS